jgi:hypothetical protein
MAHGGVTFSARTAESIAEIGRDAWNGLANPPDRPYNPFVSYDFLAALEESGSVGPGTGWTPYHLLLESHGKPAAAAPIYIKDHSYGEYVFDHHWANAFERADGRYYPKLVCAVPFTPVPGPRLLAPHGMARGVLASLMIAIAQTIGYSSLHVNFIGEYELHILESAGALSRSGVQYHWFNRGYATFDDFLATLSSRKRKAIRKERTEALSSGVAIRALRGSEITERHWDAFWNFYQDTGSRKWGRPYLTREFFRLIARTMSDDLLLFVAEQGGEPVAGALNFIGGDALYGRYWGCTEDLPFLHFELCYHRAVEFAIDNGIARVEAGAQGEHKIARGYEPVETHSAHWIADPAFRQAIARYLAAEGAQTGEEIDILRSYTPYRKDST